MKSYFGLAIVIGCMAGSAIGVLTVFSQTGSQIQLRSATTSGGGSDTSGNVTIKTAIGEPVGGSTSTGAYTVRTGFMAVATLNSVSPLNLTKVSSRKTHGSVGPIDLDITSGSGIECRSGGGSNSYSIVFAFSNPISTCGTASVGTVSHVTGSNECVISVTVPTGQYITAQLTGVADSNGNTTNASGTMGVLVGDTNADKFVDAVDVAQTKSQSGNAVSSSNFREDVNGDGFLDAVDVALVKSKSGTALSSPQSQPAASPTQVPRSSPILKSKPRKPAHNY